MRIGIRLVVGALALAGFAGLAAVSAQDAKAPAAPKRKLLVFSKSAGFKHPCIPVMEKALVELGQASGAFEATVTQDSEAFTAENLAKYDAVFFYTTRCVLPKPEQQKALFDFVKGGKGFIGSHCATDTLYGPGAKEGETPCPEYGEMIGAYFDGHPWGAGSQVVVKVEDNTHPATCGVPSPWKLADEIYQFQNFSREKVHVLMSLDASAMDVSKGKRADKDYAIAWCKKYGEGRVLYTALGHMDERWKDTDVFMKKHILPAIQWAMGDVKWEIPAK